MKLVIPYVSELEDMDARLVRLTEFLGIPFETLALVNVTDRALFLEHSISEQCSCFVVNPRVIKKWVGSDGIPESLVAILLSRFSNILVHGLRVEAFDTEIVAALSRGKLKSVERIDANDPCYLIASDSRHICETFAGISFGPVNRVNDHVLYTEDTDPAVQPLISISGRPFMAAVRLETTEILFLASEDVADVNASVGDAPLAEYFSQFVPHAMALRHAAGDECWRPSTAHASITIDDPLLQKRYGFLNFESLLHLANQHNFHVAIAFIPHNFRRNSPVITRMFQENPDRLSICFHGNDHTGGEFASSDPAILNTLLSVAEDRMEFHEQLTGLPCDRVMVFPQGDFSIEAMRVVKSHNFYAAVNRISHPPEQPFRLTIGELAQPAVLRYGGFPLFIRKPIKHTHSQDIAFDLFFGRPVLIGEHHDLFQSPELLIEIAAKINSMASEINWADLATLVSNSILTRRSPDGMHHVRAYSGTVRISNDSGSNRRYSIEWGDSWNKGAIEQVLVDGNPGCRFEVDDTGLRLSVDLAPGSSQAFSLVYRNARTPIKSLSLRWNVQAFLRRRLSELRDNYLSKNQRLLAIANALQRCFVKNKPREFVNRSTRASEISSSLAARVGRTR